MKIIVISDTHIPRRASALPPAVSEGLKGAGHIVHAGDITIPRVLSWLEELAPVTAVAGNADPPELKERLGEKKTVTLGGFRFGVFHGHGAKGSTLSRTMDCFRNDKVDCILFGHSHNPYCQWHGDILLFNPGSPTDKRRNPYFSYGVIETGEKLTPGIVYFNAGGIVNFEIIKPENALQSILRPEII